MPARPPDPTPVNPGSTGRFLNVAQVAADLDLTIGRTYLLLQSGALPAIRVGGRGQWRIERTALETYIAGRDDRPSASGD